MIRDWTDSLRMDDLSAEAERLFTRLLMKADDYGRFHADPRLVKASCFPLSESIKSSDIEPWLSELHDAGLIVIYVVEGRRILAIANYGQRLKQSRAKFPPCPGKPLDWLPMFDQFQPCSADFREVPGSSGKFPSEEKRTRRETEHEVEHEDEEKPKEKAPVGEDEVFEFWNSHDQLPKIMKASKERKAKAKTRLADPFFRERWKEAVSLIPASPFLLGQNDRGWKADIDWFLKPESLTRIIEGKYNSAHHRQSASQTHAEARREAAKTVNPGARGQFETVIKMSEVRAQREKEAAEAANQQQS